MKTKKEQDVLEPEQLHKKQTSLQVLLPIIGAGVICLSVFVLLLVSTSTETQSTEQWAQISTMFLILPALFLGLVCLAFLILLGIVAGKWNNNWPPAFQKFRLMVINFEKNIQGLAQKPAQPLIKMKSFMAGIKAIFKRL